MINGKTKYKVYRRRNLFFVTAKGHFSMPDKCELYKSFHMQFINLQKNLFTSFPDKFRLINSFKAVFTQ